MKRPGRFAFAILLILPLSIALAAGDDWKKRFKANVNSPDSSVRHEAVRQLDVNDPSAMKTMIKVLKNLDPKVTDWHIRSGAIEALSKATDEKAIKAILKEMQKGKPPIREAMVAAIGRKKQPEYLEPLVGALNDGTPLVRRAAIRALTDMKDKGAVDAILDRWHLEERTKNFRAWALCKSSLEQITGKYLGSFPQDWKNWWEVNRERFSFDEEWEDEEQKKADLEKAEEEGKKAKEIKTQTRNVDLTVKIKGFGAPILVLPMGDYSEEYFEPYLGSIQDICKVHYVRLPKVSEYKGLERGMGGIINYPVDKLVDSFEELRKEFKYKKFAILGHEITTTVAQRYVSKYPDAVSHMILVGAYSGTEAYGRVLRRMEGEGKSRGDLELEHLAQSLWVIDQQGNHKYEPKDCDERKALQHRKAWSLNFRNPHDMVVGEMFTRHRLKGGDTPVYFPEFDTFKEKRAPVPTLVMNGKPSLWTSVSDAQKISKHYPNAKMVIFERSTMMPFVEETEKFASTVRNFFKKYPYRGKG